MNKILVADLKPGLYFESPVFLDGRFILLNADIPTSQELIQTLNQWNYTVIFTPGDPQGEERLGQGALAPGANLDQDEKEKEGISKAQEFYDEFLDFTSGLFENFKKTNALNLDRITDYIKNTIDMIKENQAYILRFSSLRNDSKFPYFITHAVRSTILALTIGLNVKTVKIPPFKVIELGISCLLHEIGMMQIPEQLYNKEGILSPEEKKTITAHPILGYRLLTDLKSAVPLSQDILMGVLQHHERENGSGYPQKMMGDKISLYGKIIAIACSYDAQISSQPHSEGKDGYSTITSLIKEMQSLYDKDMVTALMSVLSLFPIGSYVVMGDESIGTVVKTSEDFFRQPYVKLQLDSKKNPIKEMPVIQSTSEGDMSIIRVLNEREVIELKNKSLLN